MSLTFYGDNFLMLISTHSYIFVTVSFFRKAFEIFFYLFIYYRKLFPNYFFPKKWGQLSMNERPLILINSDFLQLLASELLFYRITFCSTPLIFTLDHPGCLSWDPLFPVSVSNSNTFYLTKFLIQIRVFFQSFCSLCNCSFFTF